MHLKPINLICDYYGAKQAFYFAFLIHLIGWLLIPGLIGLVVYFSQIYYVRMHMNANETTIIEAFTEKSDRPINAMYIIVMVMWSTLFMESWKRTQNTFRFLWGCEERIEDFEKADKRKSAKSSNIIDLAGKKGKMIKHPYLNPTMKRKTCCCGLTQYDCGGYLVSFLTALAIIGLILCGVSVFFFFFYFVFPFFAYDPEKESGLGGQLAEKVFDFGTLRAEYYNLVLEYTIIVLYVVTMT